MGYRTNKKIKKQIDSFYKVKDLINYLQTIDPDLPIGRTGQFDEFINMKLDDFVIKESYITPNDSWRDSDRVDIKVLDIYTVPVLE